MAINDLKIKLALILFSNQKAYYEK